MLCRGFEVALRFVGDSAVGFGLGDEDLLGSLSSAAGLGL